MRLLMNILFLTFHTVMILLIPFCSFRMILFNSSVLVSISGLLLPLSSFWMLFLFCMLNLLLWFLRRLLSLINLGIIFNMILNYWFYSLFKWYWLLHINPFRFTMMINTMILETLSCLIIFKNIIIISIRWLSDALGILVFGCLSLFLQNCFFVLTIIWKLIHFLNLNINFEF